MIAATESRLRNRYIALVAVSALGFLLTLAAQIIVSYHFGTSANLDAYWIALAVVNLLGFYVHPMREALVPEFHSRLKSGANAAADSFSRGTVIIGALALIATTMAFTVPDWLVSLATSSLQEEIRTKAVSLLKLLAPAVFLFALAEVLNGILTAYDRVVSQGIVRLFGSAAVLLSIASLAGHLGIRALAVSFIVSQLVAVVAQVWILFRLGLRWRISGTTLPELKFLRVSGVLIVTYVLSHGYAIYEKNTFTFFASGLVSAFQYSAALVNVLVSLVGLTLSTILWPRFLEAVQADDMVSIRLTAARASRFLVLFLGFLCVFLFAESQKLIEFIYSRGAFGTESLAQTTLAFKASVFAAVPIALSSIVIRIMVSRHAAGSLAWIGASIAVGGTATLVVARGLSDPNAAMLHWLAGNLVGMLVAFWLYARTIRATWRDLLFGLWWCARAVLALAVTYWLLTQWTIDSVSRTVIAGEALLMLLLASACFVGLCAVMGILDLRAMKAGFIASGNRRA